MLRAQRESGAAVTEGGAEVAFRTEDGTSSGTFLPVVDNGDGTYSADFVADGIGTAIKIRAQIDGQEIVSVPPSLRVVGFTRIAVGGGSITSSTTTTGGYSCGIITTGDMYCWGIPWRGIRGNGTVGNMNSNPTPSLVSGGHKWADVGTGSWYVCAIAVGGTLYCWGDASYGNLANGNLDNAPEVTTPTRVLGDERYRTLSILMGFGGCAITITDEARCWGSGAFGRLGNGSEATVGVPTAPSGGMSFSALKTSFAGTCGIAQGSAFCWGSDVILGLGVAPPPDTCTVAVAYCSMTPFPVSGGRTFKPILSLTGNVACAVGTDDQTYCWGSGYLGNGTGDRVAVPTLVSGGHTFVDLAGGDGYTCGIAVGGAAYCWGVNDNGQLGNGSEEVASVPAPVSGGHTFIQLAAAQDHTCGVAEDGNAYCWGGNDKGELGDRTLTHSSVPVRVRLFVP